MKDRSSTRRRSYVTMAMLLAVLLLAGPAAAAVDHAAFDALLQRHVRDGRVNYAGFQGDVAELDGYLGRLADVDLSGASREERLAFYINAYNACTIRLILRHYGSIESIRDISRPWKGPRWLLAGERLTLDEVEHERLRGQIGEPRIHFAIVCASIGCPDLRDRAYTAQRIYAELDEAARAFLRSPKHVRTRTEDGWFRDSHVLQLSKIFDWFEGDFTGGGDSSVVEFVVRYTTDEIAGFIEEHRDEMRIEYLDYDWKLNETRER